MNKVILVGRLTRDPEQRQSASGKAVTLFTMAVDRPGADGQKSADFVGCVAFGRTAETIARYMSQGRQCAIEGNIKTGSYEKDGHKVYTTDVWVDRFEFVGSKGDSSQANEAFMEVTEDIPF